MLRRRPLKSYLFSLGNSDEGAIGFTARVTAASRVDALAKLKACFGDDPSVDLSGRFRSNAPEGVEYLDVYFNPKAMKLTDIEEWDFEG